MEMASVLAGQPWSDHPACTHPLLAQLARLVNDHTTDAARDRLAVHIPSVVGLTGGGDRWAVGFTGQVAVRAMPGAAAHSQRALAAGLVRVRQLTAVLGPTPLPRPEEVAAALDTVPWALSWLRRFDPERPITPKAFVTRGAPAILMAAVVGTAEAAPDPDTALRALLLAGIEAAEVLQELDVPSVTPPEVRGVAGATRRR
jgi:hypothetical protein